MMKEDDRRQLLRSFSDSEYQDVINMCALLPNVIMTVTSEGRSQNEKFHKCTITAEKYTNLNKNTMDAK